LGFGAFESWDFFVEILFLNFAIDSCFLISGVVV
jgi:hypothetical protein